MSALEEGRMRFDPTAAARCLEAMPETWDCEALRTSVYAPTVTAPEACDLAVVGTVAEGEICSDVPNPARVNVHHEWCQPGLHCKDMGESEDGWAFRCAPKYEEGETCLGDLSCFNGNCVDHVCVARLEDGEACQWLGNCAGFACIDGRCERWHTCAAAADREATQLANAHCERLYACCNSFDLQVCHESFGARLSAHDVTQRGWALFHYDLAEACIDDLKNLNSCEEYAAFSSENCVLFVEGLQGEGESCGSAQEGRVRFACQQGLYCGSSYTCEVPAEQGAVCDPALEGACAEGLSCAASGTCVTPLTVGSPCDPEVDACQNSTCQGEVCTLSYCTY